MRPSSLTLLLCLSLPAGAAEVTILDWNIFSYNDAGSDEYDALVRIVEALDPDIILFQEAQNPSGRAAFMSHFSAEYPNSFLGDPLSDNPRNQILSAYPLSNAAMIFTADPNGGDFERPTIRVDVDVVPGEPGTELRVYSTHYKSGSTSRDRTLRLNQATEDVDDIQAFLLGDPDGRVYYAGDLNSEPGDPPLNKLATALTRLPIANPNNGNGETRWVSGKTIDHIYYSLTLSGHIHDQFIFYSNTYPGATVPPPALANDSETASDHLALVTTVFIPDNPGSDEVLINEVYVRHETAQWETDEFVEFVGPPGFSLAGLSLVVIEGDAEDNPGIVDRVWSFNSAHVIPENGFFVAGDSGLAPDFTTGSFNTMENGTQTVLLVRNATVSIGSDVDLDNDGAPEVTAIGIIEDSIALADGGLGSGDHAYYGAPVFGPDGSEVPPGAARVPDGVDTDTATDWEQLSRLLGGSDGYQPSTPGLANVPGDFDRDGDVDQEDFGVLQVAFSGTGNPTPNARTDLDDDGDTDQDDFGIFQINLTGPW